MQLDEMLEELRTTRLDDAVLPYLWSDAELVSFLNDAVRQVCIRQRCLLESVDAKVCRLPFVAGQRLLKLHPAVIAVRWAAREGDDDERDLVGITSKRLSKMQPGWDRRTGCHRIRYWIPDFQEGYLAIDGTPEEDGALLLRVWRTPLDTELLELADLSGEPVIHPNWHVDLLDWAEYRAFSKKDAETIDNGRAGNALQSFEAKIGRLPSAAEIRLWGIQRIVGTRAEFI